MSKRIELTYSPNVDDLDEDRRIVIEAPAGVAFDDLLNQATAAGHALGLSGLQSRTQTWTLSGLQAARAGMAGIADGAGAIHSGLIRTFPDDEVFPDAELRSLLVSVGIDPGVKLSRGLVSLLAQRVVALRQQVAAADQCADAAGDGLDEHNVGARRIALRTVRAKLNDSWAAVEGVSPRPYSDEVKGYLDGIERASAIVDEQLRALADTEGTSTEGAN